MTDGKRAWTGGEWSIDGYKMLAGKRVGYIISYGLNAYRDGPEGYVGDVFVSEPDARLIAAAPCLAEAAERVLKAADALKSWVALGIPARSLVPEPSREAAQGAMDDLRAALSKARADQ